MTNLNGYTETKALIEQHIHGGFGIDFANCNADGFLEFAQKITEYGVCGFYPTLATDTAENLKRQISRIKEAQKKVPQNSASILGVNLEACFLNPLKKGIHNEEQLLKPTVDNYKILEDEVIKIVTLAPELDEGFALCSYLKSRGVKVSAGHCLGSDLSQVSQVTHLYNAMGEFSHKNPSTVVNALSDNNLTVELIADLKHVHKEVVELTLKVKPLDKIILISDALPIAHSDLKFFDFCGKRVFLKDNKAVDSNDTMAGSVMFTADIIKQLVKKNILELQPAVQMASANICDVNAKIFWDNDYNIVDIVF